MSLLVDAIRRHADDRPDDIAIDGATPLSWRDLAALVACTADELRAGDDGRPIATQLDHGVGETVLELAAAHAGIATIALPPFFLPQQAAGAIAAAGAGRLIAGAVAVARQSGTPALRLSVQPLTHARAALPEGTGRITFTSGSTGTPKGVCLSFAHISQVASGVVDHLGVHHAGRHLPLLPPGILLETVAGLYATIIAGGTYVALPQAGVGMADPFRPDVARMLDVIEEQTITSLILVPELLAGLVAAMRARGVRLPRLTLVAVGGARVSTDLLDAADAVGLPVRQGYGMTECGSVVTLHDGGAAGRGSVGHSIGTNRIRLAADGEIMIDGPVHLGTIGAPRAPGPLATGDIGHIDAAGRLWIDGRKSAVIVTSHGRNISPEWVEGALTATGAIAQAMVRGDGRARLDALIVPARPDADVAAAVAAANATLPAYARVEQWRVVPPFTPSAGLLTGNGRLRRAAIDQAFPSEDPMPQPFFDRLVAETREAQARFAVTPQLIAGLTGRITVADYIAYLAQAFHHVRHTVPLMEEARARLGDRPGLVHALDEYIEEETGHEQWILADIAAAGGDADAVAASEPAPATKAMVDHAYRTIREGNPAAFFGMVYVLEGTSIAMASQGAGAVQQTLGLPAGAFRYLTSHGALDQEHMVFFERLMNTIDDPADQQAIIEMARAIFALFGGMFASIELEQPRVAA